MKNSKADSKQAEHDFTGGVRGKHFRAMQAGYAIAIHQADGTVVTQEVRPKGGAVVLAPDVQEYFPDSESVNATLRSLISVIPRKSPPGRAKGQLTIDTRAESARGKS